MRMPFVAGNWKMFKTVAEARHLVSELVPSLQSVAGVDKVLCPPFTSILAVAALLEGTNIGLGAQNMHWELSGAYTGEISPSMVVELCRYVIVGHSERRKYFHEKDETVNLKVHAALAHGLTPIVCVGETLEENDAGHTAEVVARQVRLAFTGVGGLFDAEGASSVVIAYEPVWAIGTGRPSTPEGAALVIKDIIRPAVSDLFGETFANSLRVLYGGSVTGENAKEFFDQSEIDGALVGGASLKATDFVRIVQSATS